jgi:predicted Zn-dependent peptidase
MGPAMVVGQSLSHGLTLDDVETRPLKIAAVSLEDINSVFKKYLHPDTPKFLPVTGFMIPKGGK